MKKKISLVLALVIMVIPTFGFQMMQASAAAPKYEEYETFENASNLFDDTAFWSDAVVQGNQIGQSYKRKQIPVY